VKQSKRLADQERIRQQEHADYPQSLYEPFTHLSANILDCVVYRKDKKTLAASL